MGGLADLVLTGYCPSGPSTLRVTGVEGSTLEVSSTLGLPWRKQVFLASPP